jgi:hypothetical protein
MAISEAAMAGITAHGFRWKRRAANIAELSKRLGEINDDERDHSEAPGIIEMIVQRLRDYPSSESDMRSALDSAADELEGVADCEIDEINFAMGGVYDALDYWRILA